MKIMKEVREGEIITAWYGVAWNEWQSKIAICYPMPLNMLVAAVRVIVIWMRAGYRAVPVNPRDAYLQGRRDERREIYLYRPGQCVDPGKLRDFEEAENISLIIKHRLGIKHD